MDFYAARLTVNVSWIPFTDLFLSLYRGDCPAHRPWHGSHFLSVIILVLVWPFVLFIFGSVLLIVLCYLCAVLSPKRVVHRCFSHVCSYIHRFEKGRCTLPPDFKVGVSLTDNFSSAASCAVCLCFCHFATSSTAIGSTWWWR